MTGLGLDGRGMKKKKNEMTGLGLDGRGMISGMGSSLQICFGVQPAYQIEIWLRIEQRLTIRDPRSFAALIRVCCVYRYKVYSSDIRMFEVKPPIL
jgi:hypothetical protein